MHGCHYLNVTGVIEMFELIIELLLFLILFFLWLSSPGIEGIRNLLFIGIIYLGVALSHNGEEK